MVLWHFFTKVESSEFHIPWLKAIVHAWMPKPLTLVALSRIAVMVGSYLNGHVDDIGFVKDDFAVGGGVSEGDLVDGKFLFSIAELTNVNNQVALDF